MLITVTDYGWTDFGPRPATINPDFVLATELVAGTHEPVPRARRYRVYVGRSLEYVIDHEDHERLQHLSFSGGSL